MQPEHAETGAARSISSGRWHGGRGAKPMPPIIDADSHFVEPLDLWRDYIEPPFRELTRLDGSESVTFSIRTSDALSFAGARLSMRYQF